MLCVWHRLRSEFGGAKSRLSEGIEAGGRGNNTPQSTGSRVGCKHFTRRLVGRVDGQSGGHVGDRLSEGWREGLHKYTDSRKGFGLIEFFFWVSVS